MLGLVNLDNPTQTDETQQGIDQQVTVSPAADSSADGVRHRLTPAQRREIARLYVESGASVAELRKRFPISAPSVYRILQTEGVALRGHTTSSPVPASEPAKRVSRSTSKGTAQFRIEYRAERTLYAADFQDALRQAEGLGATDIVGLTRES
jgi:transposase-like protein